MLNYGLNLKNLRESRNLSQKEVAEILGIKRCSYNHFETQYTIIPLKRLNQLANYFNVSIDYLFGLNDNLIYSNIKKDIDFNLSALRLKEFRKECNLTQEKLAKILNASSSVIVHHENRRFLIATPFLYTICSKYGVSADYLLGKIDDFKYLNKWDFR